MRFHQGFDISLNIRASVGGGGDPPPPAGAGDVLVSIFQLDGLTPNCWRVRRASDDVEQDIPYLNGYVDLGSLVAFLAGSRGHITRWYSLYGGIDMLQANALVQPYASDASGLPILNDKGFAGMYCNPPDIGSAMDLVSEFTVGDGSARSAWLASQRDNSGQIQKKEVYGSSNGNHWHELEMDTGGGERNFSLECSGSGRQEWDGGGVNDWNFGESFVHGVSTPGSGNGTYPCHINSTERSPSNTPSGSSWGNGRRVRLGSGQFTTQSVGFLGVVSEFGFYAAPNPNIQNVVLGRASAFNTL